MKPTIADKIYAWLWSWLPDKCEVVDCKRQGVRGNEINLGGRLACDYCYARPGGNLEFKPSKTRRYWQNPLRWSSEENDYCWGPFLYSTTDYRPFAVIFTSWGGGEDADKPANLRMSARWFGTLIIRLPRWMVPGPTITRVYPGGEWEPGGEVYHRLQRNYYEDIEHHEYGISISNSGAIGDSLFMQVQKGRSTNDSSTDRSWSCFLPWTQWRHVRRSFYGLQGEHIDDAPQGSKRLGEGNWEAERAMEQRTPRMSFVFKDFDGEVITAHTHIEEREWRAGAGWFKWLAWFRNPIIHRSLVINFEREVGPRKGSWKGGTMGHSIELDRGPGGEYYEGHLSGFLRYCAKHDMTFVGMADGGAT